MKAWLSKAAVQLREQTDDCFPDRDRKSDGWIAGRKEADIDAIAYRAQTLLNEIENHNKNKK